MFNVNLGNYENRTIIIPPTSRHNRNNSTNNRRLFRDLTLGKRREFTRDTRRLVNRNGRRRDNTNSNNNEGFAGIRVGSSLSRFIRNRQYNN